MDFHCAVTSAFDTLRDAAGESIKYKRASAWIELMALPGRSTFDVLDSNGVVVEQKTQDYLIKESELTLNNEAVQPQRRDLIEVTKGNRRLTYEVLRPDGNEQVWRYSDLGRTIMRVHTTLKSSEAV